MMRKLINKTLFPLFCATAVLTAGVSLRSQAGQLEAAPEFVKVFGTVNQTEDGRLSITRQDGDFAGQELIITVSEDTLVLDAVNGYPAALSSLQSGEAVYAYISPAMTLSLPPMSHGELILCQLPADYQAPEYITIEERTTDGGQSGSIRAVDGTTYQVSSSCQLLPYLTRNIVTWDDLVRGRRCLVWTKPGSREAVKIIAFAMPAAAQTEQPSSGWSLEEGQWYFYDPDGSIHTGWLEDKGSWYYLDPATGVMHTGFLSLGGNTYYLQPDGRMLTEPMTFTPDENGALHGN